MRWHFLCIASLLLAVCPKKAVTAPLAEDTALLAAHLRSLRGKPWLTSVEFTDLQKLYLLWIDSRVKAGVTVDGMNRELREAALFARWPKPEDPNWIDERYKSHAGFLEPLSEKLVGNKQEILVIAARILKGAGCSTDVTAVIYDRQSQRRLAYLNANPSEPQFAFYLSGLDVGPESSSGERLVATGWVISNCTSTWNGKHIRVDRLTGTSIEQIIGRDLAAKDRDQGENVAARLDGKIVTFWYDGPTGDGDLLQGPAIARYRIAGKQSVRVPPVALTRAGFIYEWLHLTESDAARWSAPGVAATRNVALALDKQSFRWERIARCSGSPPMWEIAVRAPNNQNLLVFRISGSRATELRMLAVGRTTTPSCIPEDLSKGLSSVAAELPW